MTDFVESTGMRLRVTKRKKRDMENVDFRLTVAPVGTLQTLVSTVHCLLNEVHFFVIKSDQFEGIKVDSSTLDNTTMLKQQLTCSVDLPDGVEEVNFCVNVNDLNSRIKNGANAFEIVRYKGREDQIQIHYPNSNPHREYLLRTLTKDVVDNRMYDIATDISIQIRLSELKEIARDFHKWGSTFMKVVVNTSAASTADGINHSFFTLSSETDGHVNTITYHSQYKQTSDNDIQVVCDDDGMEDYEGVKAKSTEIYADSFPLDTICSFLKSIDKGYVWVSLSKRGPMILQYSLGNEHSNMRLILAPCVTDSDDEEL